MLPASSMYHIQPCSGSQVNRSSQRLPSLSKLPTVSAVLPPSSHAKLEAVHREPRNRVRRQVIVVPLADAHFFRMVKFLIDAGAAELSRCWPAVTGRTTQGAIHHHRALQLIAVAPV